MDLKIKSCYDCPFLIKDYEGEARNSKPIYECRMNAFGQTNQVNKKGTHELCPLKKENITVKYEI